MAAGRRQTRGHPSDEELAGCDCLHCAMPRSPARPVVRFLIAIAAAVGLAGPAAALESDAVTSERATVTLVSEHDSVQPGGRTWLGLRFKLAPGWHIYWSNPGDAGQPPQVELQAPAGTQASGLIFPVPQRLAEGPLMTYAYTGEVVLPLALQAAADAKGELKLAAKAGWLVCHEVCIPEEGRFELNLPVAGTAQAGRESALFAATRQRLPQQVHAKATVTREGVLTVGGAQLPLATMAEAWFLPAAWGSVEHAAPQAASVGEGALTLRFRPGQAFDPQAALAGLLVLKDKQGVERGYEIRTEGQAGAVLPTSELHAVAAAAAAPAAAAPAAAQAAGLAQTLLFALLGGLILNLMPCVFPVLAMKAVSIARLSGHERREVRLHAGFYTVGVLVAFAALAGVMLALRAAGSQAGWGFQFQSPLFVAGMAWLLFLVGLNLSGVFEVGSGLAGAGESLASRGGHAGSFFTGLLAVVVATPCTAPFMGAAIASALAAPPAFAVATFLAMGVGMAVPYLLLALVPGLAERLPRPGVWMLRLKQGLAFPMYAAAVWLVWVLGQQAGADGVLLVLAGTVLLGLAGWTLGVAQAGALRKAWWSGAAVVSIMATLALLPRLQALSTASAQAVTAELSAGEKAYSAQALAELRAAGKPVFVNMTAAWCVTCLVNERVALSTAGVKQAFAAGGVTYLKGDWTNQNPEITRFLQEHGRSGVPLYVFYPAGGGQAVVLPQILTEQLVLDRIGPAASQGS